MGEAKLVSVHEAKTHLSRLLARVAMGESVTISKSGRPVAKLVPLELPVEKRHPGQEEIVIAPDFDDLPKSVRRSFGMR
jgi:prevent-host-death family protein